MAELSEMSDVDRLHRLEEWCEHLEGELRRMTEVIASAGIVLSTAYPERRTQEE